MTLPVFKYHPDPIATGSIVVSDAECKCCGRAHGYIYAGPVYSENQLRNALCPWCISDGTASEKFHAAFTDEEGIGSIIGCEPVPDHVVTQVARRTPGFSGLQQEQWWTHCGDAAAFIGLVGHKELCTFGPAAIAAIQDSTGLPDGRAWDEFFAALDKDGSPTGYLFRCPKCGAFGGYHDCD